MQSSINWIEIAYSKVYTISEMKLKNTLEPITSVFTVLDIITGNELTRR